MIRMADDNRCPICKGWHDITCVYFAEQECSLRLSPCVLSLNELYKLGECEACYWDIFHSTTKPHAPYSPRTFDWRAA